MAATVALDQPVPFQGFEDLHGPGLIAQLRLRSQVELEHVDSYERAHEARPDVLAKLRYLRNEEPLDGYDGLDSAQILTALDGADSATLARVKAYEMKLRDRKDVLDGLVRARAATGADRSDEHKRVGADGRSLRDALSVGVFGLVAFAAVLMVVLLLILAFMVVTAVAPGLLR